MAWSTRNRSSRFKIRQLTAGEQRITGEQRVKKGEIKKEEKKKERKKERKKKKRRRKKKKEEETTATKTTDTGTEKPV